MGDTDRGNGGKRLLRLIVGAVIVLVLMHIGMMVFWPPGTTVRVLPWVITMLNTVVIVVASSVSFLAFTRYRVLRDSVSYWTGMGFAAFSVGFVFYLLAWPGLRQDGKPFIGLLLNTAPWEALPVVTLLGISLLAADLCPWPDEGRLAGSRWLWPLLAWLFIVTLGGVLTLQFEDKLPLLVTDSGHFTTLALSWNWVVILLFASGALLSVRRYLRAADTLPGYVSFTQMVICGAMLMAVHSGNRYSLTFFFDRFVVIAGFLVMQFGLLSEYVQLFLCERERSLLSEQSAEVLRVSQERLIQAHERLERANQELEQRVADRTAHLEEQRTELEQRNEELQATYRKLETQSEVTIRMMQEVHEKDRLLVQQSRIAAMGELIMNIAHQWRQPLNILGLIVQELAMQHRTGSLNREEVESQTRKAMQVIGELSRTINDFATFYRPDGERTAFEVNGLLAKTVAMLEGTFRELRIEIDLVKDGVVFAYGYPNEFYQVVVNILLNAKDAFAAHPVTTPQIVVRLFNEADKGIVTISDNAGGIPPAIMEKIFDPYFTTKGPDKGTGIGLYMARTLVEKNMNGSLSVRNTGEGAEFKIEFETGTPEAHEVTHE